MKQVYYLELLVFFLEEDIILNLLAVAEVDQKKNLSRITIVTTGTPQVIEQITLQLKKLVPVHKVG